jgi:glycosyltransferase involved in cell wall biosynthesis
MRVLLSAIGCHPEHGSEGGIGWNAVRALSKEHELHVLTSVSQRAALETAIAHGECRDVTFSFFGTDKPYHPNRLVARGESWIRYFKWIEQSYRVATSLLREKTFDLAHQVTYSSWRVASPLWRLPIPFVWGPVGGVASYPFRLLPKLSTSGAAFEMLRDLSSRAAMHSPALRSCAQKAAAVLASNRESASVLQRLRGRERKVHQLSPVSFSAQTVANFSCDPDTKPFAGRLELFAGGSLVGSKGIVFGLEAVAIARKMGVDCRYTIASGGPEVPFLKKRADQLALGESVIFNDGYYGPAYRDKLKACHVCLLPSFRENVGITLLETMMAGCVPLIVDASAQAENVPDDCGIKVPVSSAAQISQSLAEGLVFLATNHRARIEMGSRARHHVCNSFGAQSYADKITSIYSEVLGRTGYNCYAISDS